MIYLNKKTMQKVEFDLCDQKNRMEAYINIYEQNPRVVNHFSGDHQFMNVKKLKKLNFKTFFS
jgi:hypothetical protein